MRSDEILAGLLSRVGECYQSYLLDDTDEERPCDNDPKIKCEQCILDWSRAKADEKEVVFTGDEKVCFETAMSLLEIDPHVPFTAAENKVIESLKTKILGK